MTAFRFYLLQNKEIVLYIICFFSHGIFAPVFKYYDFTALFIYNAALTFVYGIFLLLYNNKNRIFFRNFACIEILFYTLFITLITGTDFGTRLFSICLIPGLFFYIRNSKSSLKYHITMSLISALLTIFIIWWQFLRPRAIYSGFITTVSMYKTLYRIHVVFTTVITIFFVTYLGIVTEYALDRNAEKSRRKAEELNEMANHDQLTGLYNRRKITSICEKFAIRKKETDKDYSICIFDIDNFKSVNDSYGHDAGDFILKKISNQVKEMLPKNVEIARWGGEEFLILFPVADETVVSTLEKIRAAVQNSENIWNGSRIPITLTFGVSCSKSKQTFNSITIEADDFLFYGKKHGKNQICACDKLK